MEERVMKKGVRNLPAGCKYKELVSLLEKRVEKFTCCM